MRLGNADTNTTWIGRRVKHHLYLTLGLSIASKTSHNPGWRIVSPQTWVIYWVFSLLVARFASKTYENVPSANTLSYSARCNNSEYLRDKHPHWISIVVARALKEEMLSWTYVRSMSFSIIEMLFDWFRTKSHSKLSSTPDETCSYFGKPLSIKTWAYLKWKNSTGNRPNAISWQLSSGSLLLLHIRGEYTQVLAFDEAQLEL